MEVLVVVRGPSLENFIPSDYTGNVLADPMLTFLEIPQESGALLVANNNFENWNNGEIELRFPGFIKHSKEAGLIVELPSNKSFSAIVEGVGETTGLAQIEFYEITPEDEPEPEPLPEWSPENGVYIKSSFLSLGLAMLFNENLIVFWDGPSDTYLFAGEYSLSGSEVEGAIAGYHNRKSLSSSGLLFESSLSGSLVEGESLDILFRDFVLTSVVADFEYPKELNEIPSSLQVVAGSWELLSNDGQRVSTIRISSDGTIIDETTNDCTATGMVKILNPDHNFYSVVLNLQGTCIPGAGNYSGFAYLRDCNENNDCNEFAYMASGRAEPDLKLVFIQGGYNRVLAE